MKQQKDTKGNLKETEVSTKKVIFLVFLFSAVMLASPLILWLKILDNQTWLVYFPWFLSLSLIGLLFVIRLFEKGDQKAVEEPYVVDDNFEKLMHEMGPLLKTARSKSISIHLANIGDKFLLAIQHDKTDKLNQHIEKIKQQVRGFNIEYALYTNEYPGNNQISSFLGDDVYELKKDGKWIISISCTRKGC